MNSVTRISAALAAPIGLSALVLAACANTPEVVVPQGELFLLGDNRDNANDSRVWGTVATDAVIGRAVGVWDVGSLSVRPFP